MCLLLYSTFLNEYHHFCLKYIHLIFKVDTEVDKILSLWGTRYLGKTPIRLLFCWISISILSSNVMSTTSDYKIAAVCELLN